MDPAQHDGDDNVRSRSLLASGREGLDAAPIRSTIRPIAGEREKKILAAAKTLFFERGFHAIGMDELGLKAGVTGPAVYRHFGGKDEILATLFDQGLDALFAAINQAEFDPEDPLDELAALAHAHARFVTDNRELARILVRDDSSLSKTYRRQHQRRERPYFRRWIDLTLRAFPDRSEEEATTAVFAVITMLNGVGSWPASARKVDDLPAFLGDLAFGALTRMSSVPG